LFEGESSPFEGKAFLKRTIHCKTGGEFPAPGKMPLERCVRLSRIFQSLVLVRVVKKSLDKSLRIKIISENARKQRNKFEDARLGCVFLDPKRPAQAESGVDL
jgi:hypothetical protein